MHVSFSTSELAALRLAARLLNYPTVDSLVRDAAMQAAHEVFDDGLPVIAIDAPIMGKDILTMRADD